MGHLRLRLKFWTVNMNEQQPQPQQTAATTTGITTTTPGVIVLLFFSNLYATTITFLLPTATTFVFRQSNLYFQFNVMQEHFFSSKPQYF